jgi:hypothetical protein
LGYFALFIDLQAISFGRLLSFRCRKIDAVARSSILVLIYAMFDDLERPMTTRDPGTVNRIKPSSPEETQLDT